MIRTTKGKLTEELLLGARCPRAFPSDLLQRAKRKLNLLVVAGELSDLRSPPGNRLEALGGDRKGQHSIRINDQWRICFRWTTAGAEDVEVIDYH